MTSLRNLCLAVVVLVGLTAGLKAEDCEPVDLICPNIKVSPRNDVPSLVGRWYLYASTPRDPVISKNCGLFKASYPCACVGGKIEPFPGTTSLSLTSFAQNQIKKEFIRLADNYLARVIPTCNNSAVYNAVSMDDDVPSFNVGRIGTDEGKSYLIYHICEVDVKRSTNDPIVWFFSRTPVATDAAVNAVKNILEQNKIPYDLLERIDHVNCLY